CPVRWSVMVKVSCGIQVLLRTIASETDNNTLGGMLEAVEADAWQALVLFGARQHQRYIVGLFVVADPVLDRGGDNFGDALERQMAIRTHQLEQPFLAKLAIIVFRFGYAVS